MRITAGGDVVRLRISNAFGTTPLRITAAGVARPVALGGSAVDPATWERVLFDDRTDAVPPGAESRCGCRPAWSPQAPVARPPRP